MIISNQWKEKTPLRRIKSLEHPISFHLYRRLNQPKTKPKIQKCIEKIQLLESAQKEKKGVQINQ